MAGVLDVVPAGSARIDAARPLRGKRLWTRWFAAVTVGEFLGFAVPAVTGALTVHTPPVTTILAMLAAGAVEGTLLGAAQASVIRRVVPGVGVRRWIVATAGAAVFAYAIGLLPSTVAGRLPHLPTALLVVAAAVLGSALLLSIGTAQWLVLRRAVPGSASWIVTTAIAWTVGLAVFCGLAMPLWHPGQSVPVVAAIGIAAGLLMAATTSVITGLGLCRLTRHIPRH